MKESFYFHDDTVILNYSKQYVTSKHGIIHTDVFDAFLDGFLVYLEKNHYDLYKYLEKDGLKNHERIKKEIKFVLTALLVEAPSEIHDEYINFPTIFEDIIEQGYSYWRSLQRYSVLYTTNESGFSDQSFLAADAKVNERIRELYRSLQERIQGENRVYRQLQAGTNAAMLLSYYEPELPAGYEKLSHIPYVAKISLRTPLILHPKFNKRTNKFTDATVNPMDEFIPGDEEWICYPAMVGTMLIYCYFHRNYISSCVSMANLFELASKEDTKNRKPDAIMLFGNPDGKKDTTFYHDEVNDIWIGKNSAAPEIDYFGYTKKSVLTLHNLAMMKKGWLPIHGAMVNIYLKDGTKKGLMFMGDSGAGKSETLEALSTLASDMIDHQETVFDDMGTLHLDANGKIRGQGTEIGAFVRLDDLDKGTAYKDMDRSIFFNPEKSNARVVIPAAPHSVVTTEHPVDIFLYANNYTDKRGMHFFKTREEAEPVFVEGKRFALGTTQESGLSTTFFANPFGPMQRQEECQVLIDKMFDALFDQDIPVGEVYTCLGLPNKGNHGIDEGAAALLDFVKNGKKDI
ncbi:hypothetical protein [Bulleidia sp. HCP3S3_F2]|uniref:hypothetical protein n=1 Tax=unclassified Bulleidia TaxID=2704656 RepID=UPI002A846104|nr:hypothetical protein [Erysipelotrichaceae bacterium]MDD7058163.1 hypothetical protein [Erysipelotrichaceae bacterium]MDY3661079.1 hypothetical protein [Bulleidia sp.]